MVTQISLDLELGLGPENIVNKDGDSSVPTSSNDHDAPLMPVQKRTRRWAAWTRQEEESFFAALRQVGKNFEKITSRVQSKNKDQVRYYYYRLVKRMNKLLGPDLSLDAKNSKDTIAAMLRWWSLLEKSSFKASKMHLKPRRFKIFIETLENQLLKDRKKNIRKRLSTGEENSSTSQIPAPTQSKASGHENSAIKTVLVDSQNIQKVGTGKGSLLKRNVNIGTKRTNCKPGSTAKTEKRQRKTGLVSTSAFKRWEKAAIAGVSLVADAAEHLERVDTDKEIERVQETETPGHDGSLLSNVAQSLPTNENNTQNSTKLKLQLFPLDECTQKALEMDQHNPYLELTLSTRKKISSVVEHLSRKWGNSSLLSQELVLFPYWAQRENLLSCQKWTKDSPLCAADVHNLIGSPPVFRLRYGWFTKAEMESSTVQALSCTNHSEQNVNSNVEKENVETEKLISGPINEQLVSAEHRTSSVVSWLRRETGALAATSQVENTKDAGDWADSLTSISVGDLLTESTHNMEVNSSEFQMPVVSNFLQQSSFTCDSFDAAIAAHIYKHQSKVNSHQGISSHGPSIWDAEETCDAFAFQKSRAFYDEVQSASRNDSRQAWKQSTIEELPETEKLTDAGPSCRDQMDDDHTSENPIKDFGGITDMYWPDSLGALDLDIPPRRYHNDDLILSDSLGGLNRLIASSMDAFQSCSFLGLDKKEATSTSEAGKTTSFSDFKISGEV